MNNKRRIRRNKSREDRDEEYDQEIEERSDLDEDEGNDRFQGSRKGASQYERDQRRNTEGRGASNGAKDSRNLGSRFDKTRSVRNREERDKEEDDNSKTVPRRGGRSKDRREDGTSDAGRESSGGGSDGKMSRSYGNRTQKMRGKKKATQIKDDFFLSGKPERGIGGSKTNNYTKLCSLFQIYGVNLKFLRSQVNGRARGGKKTAFSIDRRTFIKDVMESVEESMFLFQDREKKYSTYSKELERELERASKPYLIDEDGPEIHFTSLLDRLDFEARKFNQLQRMFSTINKKARKQSLGFKQYLVASGVIKDEKTEKVKGMDFIKFIESFGVVNRKDDDQVRTLMEEYGHVREGEGDLNDEEELELEEANSYHKTTKEMSNNQLDPDQEEQKNGVQMKAEEVNRREERRLNFHSDFMIKELESDFNFFITEIIPKVHLEVMRLIALICQQIYSKSTIKLSELLFEDPEDYDGNSSNLTYRAYIHAQEIYFFLGQLGDILEDQFGVRGADFRQLFSVFLLDLADDDKNIHFSQLYSLAKRKEVVDVENIHDPQTDLVVASNNKKDILKLIAVSSLAQSMEFDEQFPSLSNVTASQVLGVLKQAPYLVQYTYLDDNSILQALSKFYSSDISKEEGKYGESVIKIEELVKDVNFEIEGIKEKDKIIVEFRKMLIEAGLTIDILITAILKVKNVQDTQLSKDQVELMFRLVKYKLQEDQMAILMSVMSKDHQGLSINLNDFVEEVRKLEFQTSNSKKLKDGKTKQLANTALQPQKRFTSPQDTLMHIGLCIEEFKIKDFGSYLKGFDFKDNFTILVSDLFQVFNNFKEFKEQGGMFEGDIIDLISYLDPQRQGRVSLQRIKTEIDPYISEEFYQLQLESKVKDLCHDTIVRRIQDKSKSAKSSSLKRPKCIVWLAFDIVSAVLGRRQSVKEYFSQYSSLNQGFLTEEEMELALAELGVKASQKDLTRTQRYMLNYQYQILVERHTEVQSKDDERLETNRTQEDYDNLGLEIEKSDSLEIEFLEKVLKEEVGEIEDGERIKNRILEEIAREVSEGLTPVEDVVDVLRRDSDDQSITSDEFKYSILLSLLKLQTITDPKAQLLQSLYEDPENRGVCLADQFIEDVRETGDRIGVVVYLTQTQIDNRDVLQTNQQHPDFPAFISGLQEPEIFESRSDRNTFLLPKDKEKMVLPKWEINDPLLSQKMLEIMLLTRAEGKSVEEFFRSFGSKQPGMITFIDQSQIQRALISLGVKWGEDRQVIQRFREMIFQNDSRLSLSEIAAAVLEAVSQPVEYFQNEYLEKMHELIMKRHRMGQLPETIEFLNYQRDYTCTVNDFIALFRSNFQISSEEMEEWQIRVIMQKYLSDEGGLWRRSGQTSQRVFYLGLMRDIGRRNKGIKFRDIKYAQLAEILSKQVAVHSPQDPSFFRFVSNQVGISQTNIKISSLIKACRDLNLDKRITSVFLGDFFQVIGGLRKQDTITIESQDDTISEKSEQAVSLSTMSKNFSSLMIKSQISLFQDILNQIYVDAKNKNLYQTMYTIFTDVDVIDGQNDGYISTAQFIQVLQSSIGTDHLTQDDFEFLSLKYRQINSKVFDDRDKVYYKFFYSDFQELEQARLGQKIDGLLPQEISKINTQIPDKDNPLAFKIPQKFLDFYSDIKQLFENPSEVMRFCEKLVSADKNREGFLSNSQIHKVFDACNIRLRKQEVGKATYCLHMDGEGKYSYPELIELIFGKKQWLITKSKYQLKDLNSKVYMGGSRDIDSEEIGKVTLSESLKLMIEFNFEKLQFTEKRLTNGSSMCTLDIFLLLFPKSGISLSKTDSVQLKNFFTLQRSDENGTVSIQDLIALFMLSNRLELVRGMLKAFFTEIERIELANVLMQNQEFSFEQIIAFLQKVEFNLDLLSETKRKKNQGNMLREIQDEFKDLYDFYQAAKENHQFISKTQLYSAFGIKELDSQVVQRLIKKYETLLNPPRKIDPLVIDQAVRILKRHIDQDPKRKARIQQIKTAKIDQQQFVQLLNQINYKIQNTNLEVLLLAFRPEGKDEKEEKKFISVQLLKSKLEVNEPPPPPEEKKKAEQTKEQVKTKSAAELAKEFDEIMVDVKKKRQLLDLDEEIRFSLYQISMFLNQSGKSQPVVLFEEMDKNKSGSIIKTEFTGYLTRLRQKKRLETQEETEAASFITVDKMNKVFDALDLDNDKKLDLKEFCLKLAQVKQEFVDISDSLDSVSQEMVKSEISNLFKRVDVDRDGIVGLSDMVQFLSLILKRVVEREEAANAIKQYMGRSEKQRMGLDEDEFGKLIKRQLSEFAGKCQQYIDNYNFLIMQADSDGDGLLTTEEFRNYLLRNVIADQTEVGREELDLVVAVMDRDHNGLVDLQEFSDALRFSEDVMERIKAQQGQGEKAIKMSKCFQIIRKAVGCDIFDYFRNLDKYVSNQYFTFSTLDLLLVRDFQLLPSDFISLPEGLDKSLVSSPDSVLTMDQKEMEYLQMKVERVEGVGVPYLQGDKGLFKTQDIVRRELRVALVDSTLQKYLSRPFSLLLDANYDGSRWNIDFDKSVDLASEILIKVPSKASNLLILFELVIRVGKEEEKQETFCNGWGYLSPYEVIKMKDDGMIRVELTGGIPTHTPSSLLAENLPKSIDNYKFPITLWVSKINFQNLSVIERIKWILMPENLVIPFSVSGIVIGIMGYVLSKQEDETERVEIVQTLKTLEQMWHYPDLLTLVGYVWTEYFSPENTDRDYSNRLTDVQLKSLINYSLKFINLVKTDLLSSEWLKSRQIRGEVMDEGKLVVLQILMSKMGESDWREGIDWSESIERRIVEEMKELKQSLQ